MYTVIRQLKVMRNKVPVTLMTGDPVPEAVDWPPVNRTMALKLSCNSGWFGWREFAVA